MLDWKVIVAGLVAVLLVSSLLVGDFGLKDLFSGTVGKLSEWLGGSPFGGLFPSPESGSREVIIELHPEAFTLSQDAPVDISLDSINLTGFMGTTTADFHNNTISLEDQGGLDISMPIQRLTITNVNIRSLELEDMKYRVVSGDSDISSENGTMEIGGFSGSLVIEESHIQLAGNVSLVRGPDWTIS